MFHPLLGWTTFRGASYQIELAAFLKRNFLLCLNHPKFWKFAEFLGTVTSLQSTEAAKFGCPASCRACFNCNMGLKTSGGSCLMWLPLNDKDPTFLGAVRLLKLRKVVLFVLHEHDEKHVPCLLTRGLPKHARGFHTYIHIHICIHSVWCNNNTLAMASHFSSQFGSEFSIFARRVWPCYTPLRGNHQGESKAP